MTDYLPGHEAHYLPADAYPGLLDGWCGPLVDRAGGERIVCVDGTVWYVDCARTMRRDEADLDCRRREVIHRVVDVLAAGEKCPECSGEGSSEENAEPACNRDGEERIPCETCSGTGYLYAPVDLAYTRDLPDAWKAGPILALSVQRVAAGQGALSDLLVWSGWHLWGDDIAAPLTQGIPIDFGTHILVPGTAAAVYRVERPMEER